jgi:hypothetical protein
MALLPYFFSGFCYTLFMHGYNVLWYYSLMFSFPLLLSPVLSERSTITITNILPLSLPTSLPTHVVGGVFDDGYSNRGEVES